MTRCIDDAALCDVPCASYVVWPTFMMRSDDLSSYGVSSPSREIDPWSDFAIHSSCLSPFYNRGLIKYIVSFLIKAKRNGEAIAY